MGSSIECSLCSSARTSDYESYECTGLSVFVEYPLYSYSLTAVLGLFYVVNAFSIRKYVKTRTVRKKQLGKTDHTNRRPVVWFLLALFSGPFVWLIWSIYTNCCQLPKFDVSINGDSDNSFQECAKEPLLPSKDIPSERFPLTPPAGGDLPPPNRPLSHLHSPTADRKKIKHLEHERKYEGSHGVVCKVEYNGSLYAMKMPRIKQALNDRDKRRFEREMNGAFTVRHKNCVPMYYSCADDDGMFLLMEWMDGGSLYHLLGNHSTASLSSLKRLLMARDIADGINYLHANNIVHRDIKSFNVLVSSEFVAKVSDFGLASFQTATNSMTSDSSLGTVPWDAPETFAGLGTNGKERDIYALGVVMWELLTCDTPFLGDSKEDIRAKVLDKKRPEIPDPLPIGFPPEYIDLMKRCWHQVRMILLLQQKSYSFFLQEPSCRPTAETVLKELNEMSHRARLNEPLKLYPDGHVLPQSSDISSILLKAMSNASSQHVVDSVVSVIRDLEPKFVAEMGKYGLTQLEAHCICAYTCKHAGNEAPYKL